MSFVRATASEIVDFDSNPDPIESTKLPLNIVLWRWLGASPVNKSFEF